jgi:hypothetical protein
MPFNLIMKRKVFVKVQILCEKYEEKFNEKIATAKVVNVLLAEALIHRKDIPEDFIEKQYGCPDPIEQGFTAKARKESAVSASVIGDHALLEQKDKQFKGQLEQWELHPDPDWKRKVLEDAEQWKDRLESARALLKLRGLLVD